MAKAGGTKTSRKRHDRASATVQPARPAKAGAAATSRIARWAPLVLVASALLAYHNSLDGPFIFDDVPNIRNNYKIRRLTPLWETMWGPLDTGVSGRPIVQMSYALGYAVHGLDVRGYHATNLALHVATSLVLFGIMRRALRSPRLVPRCGAHADVLALLVTLVWQVHPLLSDSVTYISGRTEILGALFLLLTLYCAIRAAQSPRHPRLWQIAAVFSCAIGTGCKEFLAAAPLLVLLYDRLFIADSVREAFRARGAMYAGLFASLALIPLNLYMADFHRSALVGQEQLNSWDYLKTQAQVLVLYLRLAVWPHPLILDYYGWDPHPSLASVLPHGLLILALLGLTTYGLLRLKPAAFAGAWFFLILAPTSSFLPLPTEIATERRMYLPLMAIVALLVLVGYRVIGSTRAGRVVGCGILALILAAGTGRTFWRNEDFKDPVQLWSDVAARRPDNARAFDNLAYEFLGRGNDAAARECFLKAIELNPQNHTGLNNVATIYMRQGNDAEAVKYLERAMQVRPQYASPYLNLGKIQLKRGNVPEAERLVRESLRLQPDRVDSLVVLSQVLTARGDYAEAERASMAALRLDPQSAAAYDALGLALAGSNRMADALRAFRAALQLAPTDAEYATHLAWHLAVAEPAQGGSPADAVALASRVSDALGGQDPAALDALALARAAAGQFDVAIAQARRALELAKRSPRAAAIEQRLAAYSVKQMPGPNLRLFGT